MVKKYFVEVVVVEGDIYMVNCVANSSSSMLKCFFISSCFFAKKLSRLSRLAPREKDKGRSVCWLLFVISITIFGSRQKDYIVEYRLRTGKSSFYKEQIGI